MAHDPSRLPLAAGARFTEDSHELKLGEGLWKTVTGKGDFRQDYIDRNKQIAAAHVLLFEENAQILYSVVLRVADRKIKGIETLVDRITPNSRFQPDSLDKPLAGMSQPVPAGQADAARGDGPHRDVISPRIADRQFCECQNTVCQRGLPRGERNLHCRRKDALARTAPAS